MEAEPRTPIKKNTSSTPTGTIKEKLERQSKHRT